MSTRVSPQPELPSGRWLGGLVLTALAGVAGVQAWLADWPGGAAPDVAQGEAAGAGPGSPEADRVGAQRTAEGTSRTTPRRNVRCPSQERADLEATPLALSPASEDDTSLADEDATDGEPTRRELERELTALRLDNVLLTEQIATLEQQKADLQIDVHHNRLGADLHHALRLDFADVALGSVEVGDLSWSFESELADILLSSAEVMRPSALTDPTTGYELPNPEAFDWPSLRSALGDGLIRSVGQALPGLLRERALAASVQTWYSCGGGCTTTVRYHGVVGGDIVESGSVTVPGDSHPIVEAARREDEQFEARYHRAIESLLGLRIYDDE